jgi:hypothetical protein
MQSTALLLGTSLTLSMFLCGAALSFGLDQLDALSIELGKLALALQSTTLYQSTARSHQVG